MSGFDRFTEFLRREARGYHDPPDAPADAMWRGVDGRMGEAAEGAADRGAIDALGYNEAPATPREEMWRRIEAAWALRESSGAAEGEVRAGLLAARGAGGARGGRIAAPRRWMRRRGAGGWAAGLAAAASLVLGIALGRDLGPSPPDEAGTMGGAAVGETVAGQREPAAAATSTGAVAASAADPQSGGPAATAEPEPVVAAARVLPVVAARSAPPAAAALGEPESQPARFAEGPPGDPTAAPGRLAVRRDHETIRYLGRAETLLTAFRTDQRTRLTERDLASWGRELLIETRMRLDLPVSRTPEELALLEDLELVLLQISRLGSGASDVEWLLARESMELKSALPRVRAATVADGL